MGHSVLTFDKAFDRLIGNEGGYTNDPQDPGGETNWGITWPILHRGIGQGIVAVGTTIKSLMRDQAKALYKAYFWDAAHADKLFDGVAYQLFDWAANSGPDTAIRGFQRALQVADDGRVGPVTLDAANTMIESDQIMRINAERLDFMRKLKKWPNFGAGWAGRIANDLRYGAQDS